MDLTIVGTGPSALLLAQALVRRRCFTTLRLIGPRRAPAAHLLSYWSDGPTPFDAHTAAMWKEVRLCGADEVVAPLTRFTYRTLRAARWVEAAMAEVLAAPGVEHVDAPVLSVNGQTVHTRRGDFTADWLFSSVKRSTPPPSVWQRFEGWEIETDAEVPAQPTLMDFRTPADGDLRFVYALPLQPGRLFVEHVAYRRCVHAGALEAYLRDVLKLSSWRVVDREGGATPLYLTPPQRVQGRVVQLGVAAGLAKVCTGYALTRMWRDAEAIAEGLATKGAPEFPKRPPLLARLADRFFLDLLEREPTRFPALMTALFSRATGDDALAFLDEVAPLGARLAVARAMPGWFSWWLDA